MASTNATIAKTVTIIARYYIIATGLVCYLIRNGAGKHYCVTLPPNGGVPGCYVHHGDGTHTQPCPAFAKGLKCYHVKHVEAAEEKRKRRIEEELAAEVLAEAAPRFTQPAPCIACGEVTHPHYLYYEGICHWCMQDRPVTADDEVDIIAALHAREQRETCTSNYELAFLP